MWGQIHTSQKRVKHDPSVSVTKAHAFCDIDRWFLETLRYIHSGIYSTLTIIKFRTHQYHSREFPHVPTEENVEYGNSDLEVDAVGDWYETWALIYFVTACVIRLLCCFIFKIVVTMFSSHSCSGKAASITYLLHGAESFLRSYLVCS